MIFRYSAFVAFLILSLHLELFAQEKTTDIPPPLPRMLSLEPASTLHKGRFYTTLGLGSAAFAASMIGLQTSWYAEHPQTNFRLFNDFHEWNQMDKMGHWFSSYQQTRLVASGARWAGLPPRKAAWMGFAASQLFQTSFEVMDGFSEGWGFSLPDVGFNTLGAGMVVAQEYIWQEQRISMKMSAMPQKYPDLTLISLDGLSQITLQERADALYGTGFVNLFLKNYNTLTIWSSFNVRSFLPNRETSRFPAWLNVAVGMGADNIFVGSNRPNEGNGYAFSLPKGCEGGDCRTYLIPENQFPRTRQMYLSLDIDLTRIKTKSRFLKTVFSAVNVLKIPAPALEINNRGGVYFHPLFF